MRYDAFLSYSHIADREHAAALQRTLQRLARPFYRLKALNVFRDETNLVTDPRLWPSIERALGEARFFILLASPPAAQSRWCAKEVAWWLEHRSINTLLIAVTGGELVYDEAQHDFDWVRTTALPPLLRGRFLAEPMHCDLRWVKRSDLTDGGSARFRSEVLPLAAALHGMEPQALDGEDLRQFRRARRFWRAAGAGLVALTVTSFVAMGMALRKEQEAERERQVAVARRLAAEAESLRLGRALASTRAVLVAVEAARRLKILGLDSVELDHSLRTSLSLMLPRPSSLPHAGASALAASADVKHVLSAGLDGAVGLWELATRRELTRLAIPVVASEVAISPDLTLVAFATEGDVQVWSVPERRRVSGWTHRGKVTAVAFSPNSRQLATGGLDGEVEVVALADGREVSKLKHGAAIERIVFSADSRFLATATGSTARRMLRQAPEDEAAHVWDLASGQRVAHLAHEHVVSSVAFSADGARIATGTLGGIARVWDIASQRELAQARHPDGVAFVGFFPDGRNVASASRPLLVASHDQTVQVWDATSGQERGRVTHPDAVRDLAFSPDGRWVASISNDGSARLIGADGREAARAPVPGLPSVLRFTSDSRHLLVGSAARIVVLPAEGGFGPRRVGLTARVYQVVVAPGGSAVATVEGSAELVVRDAGTLAPMFRVAHDELIVAAAFSSDGQLLGTAGVDGSARLWNAANGALLRRLEHGGKLRALSFAPDSRTLATAGSDGTACIWQVDTGELLRRVKVGSGVRAAQLDATRLFVVSDDGVFTAWDQANGQPLISLKTGLSDPSMVVGPSGRQVAVFGFDPTLWLIDLTGGRQAARLMHEESVSTAMFLPDGRLATGTWGGRLRLWGGAGPSIQAQAQHDAEVTALALSADGRFIASGSSDRTARLWRAADLGAIASLPHPIAVSALAFDPSGRRLWVSTGDVLSGASALRSWLWPLTDLVDEACSRADRNLSLDEWRQFLPGEPYRRSCPGLPTHVSVLAEDLAAAQVAAQQGRAREAQRRYTALANAAADTDDAPLANQACWMGSLDGSAAAMLPLCERAVLLSPGDFKAMDTRGLARALSGDVAGALADFNEFIDRANLVQIPQALVARRQAWVQAMREGRDPFDTATRDMLRRGE